jgi:hypothetical protein
MHDIWAHSAAGRWFYSQIEIAAFCIIIALCIIFFKMHYEDFKEVVQTNLLDAQQVGKCI